MTETPLHTVLHDARIASGRLQADVAADLGMTQTGLSYWENGHRSPSLADAERWAQAVGYRVVVASVQRACGCGDEAQYWRGWDDCAAAVASVMASAKLERSTGYGNE